MVGSVSYACASTGNASDNDITEMNAQNIVGIYLTVMGLLYTSITSWYDITPNLRYLQQLLLLQKMRTLRDPSMRVGFLKTCWSFALVLLSVIV